MFKCSFDKANRTSLGAFRGPGVQDGLQARSSRSATRHMSSRPAPPPHRLPARAPALQVLQAVRTAFDVPIVTDIHEPWQAEPVACVARRASGCLRGAERV